MKLSEAITRGLGLVVDNPVGGLRFAAEVFQTPVGIVFLDIGWDTAASHPIHIVPGTAGEGPPWTLGDTTIRLVQETDPVVEDMLKWTAYRLGDGAGATRQLAQAYVEEFLQGLK